MHLEKLNYYYEYRDAYICFGLQLIRSLQYCQRMIIRLFFMLSFFTIVQLVAMLHGKFEFRNFFHFRNKYEKMRKCKENSAFLDIFMTFAHNYRVGEKYDSDALARKN